MESRNGVTLSHRNHDEKITFRAVLEQKTKPTVIVLLENVVKCQNGGMALYVCMEEAFLLLAFALLVVEADLAKALDDVHHLRPRFRGRL